MVNGATEATLQIRPLPPQQDRASPWLSLVLHSYETWTVSLWLDNERHSHEYWRRQAAEHRQAAPTCELVVDGVWTAEQAAKFNLADQLKEETLDGSPLTMPSLYGDLLTAAFVEVNWPEIADCLLADFAEQEQPASEVAPG